MVGEEPTAQADTDAVQAAITMPSPAVIQAIGRYVRTIYVRAEASARDNIILPAFADALQEPDAQRG